MNNKTKVALGISLALILSGCGQTQSAAEKACQEFKNKSYESASKAFSELARKNPAYMDQATDAYTITEYLDTLKKWKKEYDSWKAGQKNSAKSNTTDSLIKQLDNNSPPKPPDPSQAEQAIRNLQIFCK